MQCQRWGVDYHNTFYQLYSVSGVEVRFGESALQKLSLHRFIKRMGIPFPATTFVKQRKVEDNSPNGILNTMQKPTAWVHGLQRRIRVHNFLATTPHALLRLTYGFRVVRLWIVKHRSVEFHVTIRVHTPIKVDLAVCIICCL